MCAVEGAKAVHLRVGAAASGLECHQPASVGCVGAEGELGDLRGRLVAMGLFMACQLGVPGFCWVLLCWESSRWAFVAEEHPGAACSVSAWEGWTAWLAWDCGSAFPPSNRHSTAAGASTRPTVCWRPFSRTPFPPWLGGTHQTEPRVSRWLDGTDQSAPQVLGRPTRLFSDACFPFFSSVLLFLLSQHLWRVAGGGACMGIPGRTTLRLFFYFLLFCCGVCFTSGEDGV